MAIIANRVKIKVSFLDSLISFSGAFKKAFALLSLLSLVYFVYFSRPIIFSSIALESTGKILSLGNMIYESTVARFGNIYGYIAHFDELKEENKLLRVEITRLRGLNHGLGLLKMENESLKKILNVAQEAQDNFVVAKPVALTIGPMVSYAIIEAGNLNGIEVNDTVVTERGLLGRVTEVSDGYAGVMLINDHSSRVPVITEASGKHGIVAKQGDHLKLIYIDEENLVQPGENLYTSGDGKIYPYGLKVGKIEKVNDEGIFVKTEVNLNYGDFVLVKLKNPENVTFGGVKGSLQ